MVPVTGIAFLLASILVKNAFDDFTIYDGFGLVMVAIGVCSQNLYREKQAQVCIIDGELRKNDTKDGTEMPNTTVTTTEGTT